MEVEVTLHRNGYSLTALLAGAERICANDSQCLPIYTVETRALQEPKVCRPTLNGDYECHPNLQVSVKRTMAPIEVGTPNKNRRLLHLASG